MPRVQEYYSVRYPCSSDHFSVFSTCSARNIEARRVLPIQSTKIRTEVLKKRAWQETEDTVKQNGAYLKCEWALSARMKGRSLLICFTVGHSGSSVRFCNMLIENRLSREVASRQGPPSTRTGAFGTSSAQSRRTVDTYIRSLQNPNCWYKVDNAARTNLPCPVFGLNFLETNNTVTFIFDVWHAFIVLHFAWIYLSVACEMRPLSRSLKLLQNGILITWGNTIKNTFYM